MDNNSDYKKVRTQIEKLLPAPYQSETNAALMENTFNRFLTKKETKYVDGYVGNHNTNAIQSRQITENSIISQANQLQPIISAILGTEKKYMGWDDIINELEALGVDMESFPEWGRTEKYNWVPPIDIDKLIHFRDYFWVNPDANSSPEYITIKSVLNEATAKLRSLENMVERYGESFPINALRQATDTTFFVAVSISMDENFINVVGDASQAISQNDYVTIKNTVSNNKQVQVIGEPIYDMTNDVTKLPVDGTLSANEQGIGQICHTKYNGIEISDDFTLLFEDGFVFFIKDSNNAELDAQFAVVNTSTLSNDSTLIELDRTFTDSRFGGIVSLIEQINAATEVVATHSIPVTQSERQWSENNFWVHRADVTNFASARQANYPIIEYFRGLELSEYLEIVHNWRYRADTGGAYSDSTLTPTLIELQPFSEFTSSNGNTEIILSQHYGNLTDLFAGGFIFRDSMGNDIVVASSKFRYDETGKEWNTVVTTLLPFESSSTFFQPSTTSNGDNWLGYDHHWVYGGVAEELPSNAVPFNFLNAIDSDAPSKSFPPNHPVTGAPTGPELYTYEEGSYAQRFTVVDTENRTFEFANSNLRDKIVVNQNDLRVYLNGVRMHGGYTELEDGANAKFVVGIELNSDILLSSLDVILIEIASSTLTDHGMTGVRVRVIEDDLQYAQLSDDMRTIVTSLVRHRKIEQVKSTRNQYPQFSIYNVDGTDSNITSPIFEYKVDQTQEIATELGMRVVVDSLTEDYTFKQSLLNESDELYAYSTSTSQEFWINAKDQIVYKNVDGTWDKDFRQGIVFGEATYSDTPPATIHDGLAWFNSVNNTLYVYNNGEFVIRDSVILSENNPSLSTIWQKADQPYIPEQKDWHSRTRAEYDAEQESYVAAKAESLRFNNPDMSDDDVEFKANEMWFTKQKNNLSPTGEWIGAWTMPDYLFFNPQNENRINITTRELVGHFESIINSQNRIPGYVGDRRSQFHVLTQDEIDFGIGGNIHQYNNNFSTFISSVFIDNVVLPDLFEFAQNQYQILLDNSRDIALSNIQEILTTPLDNSDIESLLTDKTLADRSENSNLEFIYGDTTMFDPSTQTGVRNWVATLPNIGVVESVRPSTNIDSALNLYELVHHDSHRVNYAIDTQSRDGIFEALTAFYASESGGVVTQTSPAKSFSQLLATVPVSQIDSISKGFYWLNTETRKVYFSFIDFVQDGASSVPATIENTFWFDTDTTTLPDGELKYSDGTTWTAVDVATPGDLFNGDTVEESNVTVWREIDLSELLLNTMLEIETRLYDATRDVTSNRFNVNSNLEEYFLQYTKNTGIDLPFLNTDFNPIDPFSWNYKSSVFGRNFNIVSIDIATNSFVISGAVKNIFQTAPKFYIKNSNGNDGTWTIDVSNPNVDTIIEDLDTQTTTITVKEPITSVNTGLLYMGKLPSSGSNTGGESAVYWKALYQEFYNTPYPNLEPWKLQGYVSKPTWWDAEYKNDDPTVYGNRLWKHKSGSGMWSNILQGIVPSTNYLLPSGAFSTTTPGDVTQYDYLSVNIGDSDVTSDLFVTYKPDDLYPPYFDHIAAQIPSITNNRSLFHNRSFEVLNPSDNFVFGENSKIEYEWRASSQFLYDNGVQAYIEGPIDFVSKTFGYESILVGDLLIDSKTNNVPSYKRTTFHGEINGTVIEKFNGINQWYINYNRYTNVDTNFSNFLQLWTKWTAPLSYKFNSFIDVRTLDIDSARVPVEPNIDYSVFIKKTNGVESFSIAGLSSTLLNIPPKVVNYDNSHLWKVQISNNATRGSNIPYYGVKNYPFYADVDTNIMKIYTYKIENVEELRKTIDLENNLTDVFKADTIAKFSNGEELLIFASTYNDSTNLTTLYFTDSISTISIEELISADITTLPWNTGDSIWFTTERKLPAPLFGDTPPIGPIQYFIIKISDTEFRVAETERNAQANLPIAIISSGMSVHHVGEIVTTFIAGDGVNTNNYWRHYALDKRIVKSINTPAVVDGMQTYINIVDGYVERLGEMGFSFADNTSGWQKQIDRFIDYSFSVRQLIRNRTIGNRYKVRPNKDSNKWTWEDGIQTSPIPNGSPINIVSATGIGLPAPFLAKIPYYLIVNLDGSFGLAASMNKAAAGIAIPLLDNGSANDIEIYAAVDNVTRFPRIEVNTFRNSLSFMPPYGVVSDVIEGPFADINVANSLRDQYGDPLLISDFTINRHDAKTDVALTTIRRIDDTIVANEIDDLGNEGYHYISSATFYIDTYEHIVEFTDYTSDGNLIYDGFIGLNLRRLNMNFNRPDENSLRPNIGGSTIISEGRNLTTVDNIERMVDDLRNAYGSVADNESNRYASYARATLGYDINSTEDYLNSIDINERSQFLFWQGLIQVKGATRSVDSFINSKKFIDAQIDEFWAYEIADFGSVEEQEFPQMFININDVVDNNAKFEFIEASEIATPGLDNSPYGIGGYDINAISNQGDTGEFTAISIADNDRWYRQPNQAAILEDNGLVMYFESRPISSMVIDVNDFINQDSPIIVHNFKTDGVVVTVEFPEIGIDQYVVGNGFIAGDNIVNLRHKYVPFAGSLTVFKNGIVLDTPVDYVDVNQIDAGVNTTDSINLTVPLTDADVIEVSYGTATLDSNIHFDIVNADIIRFRNDELFKLANKITIWNFQSNFEAHNASKLIDTQSDVVVSDISLFDPARGVYNQQVFNEVDVISDLTPASFNRTEKLKIEPPREAGFITKNEWSSAEVGTIWLDSSDLYYIPYYDENIFTTVDERLEQWGKQTDFSRLRVFEWVESDVPPEEYADLVSSEQGNTSIPEFRQKSGTPKNTVFYIERGGEPDFSLGFRELHNRVVEYNVATDGQRVSADDVSFIVTPEFLSSDYYGIGSFGVYINGIFLRREAIIDDSVELSVTVNGLKDADYVQFVIDYDVDQSVLDAAVEAGIVRLNYEHTKVVTFTDLGEVVNKYYFWVENKLTRPRNNTVSAKEIQNRWTTVNSPYLVLQKPVQAARVESSVLENVEIDYQFPISNTELQSDVSFLQVGQRQDSYSNSVDAGSYAPGIGYQPDDIIEMNNGTLVKVISSDGNSSGEITDFEIIFSGITQPSIGDVLTQVSITTESTNPGSGFELTPSVANFGGFVLRLGSALKSLAGEDITPTDSSDTLMISINGQVITEKNDVLKSGEYIISDANTIIIARSVSLNDTISVSYESNRPTRVDNLPDRYTQAIVRNIDSFISENDRYTVRFRKDFTDDSTTELDNKVQHKQWRMFREHQQSNIDRSLWDKVTESMIGHLMNDETILVPSIARRLYDTQNSDTTRFGLGVGQTFVDGAQAIETLVSDINDVDNEFRGVDVASFLASNKFDTTDSIITSMNTIYTTFPTEDVNRMFFLFLNDALSNETEYAKLLKTSMISVFGVKVLDTSEIFDE